MDQTKIDNLIVLVKDAIDRIGLLAGRAEANRYLALGVVLGHLHEILQELTSGALPPPELRVKGIGRIVTDSWPLGTDISELVVKIEQRYRDL